MGSLPLMPPEENLKKMYTGSSNHDEGRVRCKLSMFTFSTESKFPKNPPWPPQVPLSLGNVRLPSSPSVHILRFSAFLPICCIDPIFLEGDTLKDDPVSFLIYLLWSSVTSHIWLFATPWTTACQASLSLTISQSLVKLWSLNMWCHPTISSAVSFFSFCLQSFPASGSFPMSQLFVLGGQSIGASASALVLPISIQGWFL